VQRFLGKLLLLFSQKMKTVAYCTEEKH